jgi:hypothetical protein
MRGFQQARRAAETASSEEAAQIILIPMSLRALWTDVLALDKRVDNASFRFAAIVGAHFNRRSGNAFLTIETIARAMGMSERTAYGCAKKLEDLGYLVVKRREFGTITRKTANGEFQVRAAGGKGVANTYLPALEGSQVAATCGGQNLEKRRGLLLKLSTEKSTPKATMDCDHSELKVAAHCDPTLSVFLSGKQNTSRAREPSDAEALGPLGAIIRHEIGEDGFRAWFSKATIVNGASVATISLPNKFFVSQVENRYGMRLLHWLRLADKDVRAYCLTYPGEPCEARAPIRAGPS